MMKSFSSVAMMLALGSTAVPVSARPGMQAEQPIAATPQGVPVRVDGLVATWYPPASGKRGPAILALGGSEGGETSVKRLGGFIAAHGYGVLALAYFKADGLPQTLQNIPLDYFARALRWIAAQPLVDRDRIGVYGVSIGGETALVVGSRHPELRAVVAAVPSSVIWQGYNPADYTSINSTYTENGVGVPYLPYDNSAAFTGIYDLYARSLTKTADHPAAIIPVEKIGGALLLLSAKDDKLWPSSMMADQVMARLDARRFAHPHQHIAYPDAGHGALIPRYGPPRDGSYDNIGGTEAGNAAARKAAWPVTLAFFDRYLGVPPK